MRNAAVIRTAAPQMTIAMMAVRLRGLLDEGGEAAFVVDGRGRAAIVPKPAREVRGVFAGTVGAAAGFCAAAFVAVARTRMSEDVGPQP